MNAADVDRLAYDAARAWLCDELGRLRHAELAELAHTAVGANPNSPHIPDQVAVRAQRLVPGLVGQAQAYLHTLPAPTVDVYDYRTGDPGQP